MARITRRDVDVWLDDLQRSLRSIAQGPRGDFRARCTLLEHRIDALRDTLGVWKGRNELGLPQRSRP